MTYKQMYKKLSPENKRKVMDGLEIDKFIMKRYCDGSYSPERRAIYDRDIQKMYKYQETLKTISFDLKKRIRVDTDEEIQFIDYDQLMSFKLMLDEEIHDLALIKPILDNAEIAIKHLHETSFFELKEAITKYILK